MGFIFNAEEILEFALQIEKNGAQFYRQAAEYITDTKARNLLNTLAEVEHKHELIFSSMKLRYESQKQLEVYDPEGERELYLHAMANGYIFDKSKNAADLINPESSVKEILLFALGREKDSIIFYLGMKEFVKDTDDKETLNKIIAEEMSHVSFISRELKRLEG